jgi:hypothetical protein
MAELAPRLDAADDPARMSLDGRKRQPVAKVSYRM